jgi:hypothetical protein
MRGTSKQIKTKNLLKEEEKEEGIVLWFSRQNFNLENFLLFVKKQ